MRTIKLVCDICGLSFDKETKEYNRRKRLNKNRFFCSGKCAGIKKTKGYNAFKFMLLSSKKNTKKRSEREVREYDLTEEFLKEKWNEQKGKCSYTKIDMILPHHTTHAEPNTASLDRIDSSKGYTKDNVEFVCVFVNLGKNGFSKNQVEELFNKMGAHVP